MTSHGTIQRRTENLNDENLTMKLFCGCVRLSLVHLVQNKLCYNELGCVLRFLMNTTIGCIITFAVLSHPISLSLLWIQTSIAEWRRFCSCILSVMLFTLLDARAVQWKQPSIIIITVLKTMIYILLIVVVNWTLKLSDSEVELAQYICTNRGPVYENPRPCNVN